MTRSQILPAWGRILGGYRPFLSIEITKECPLHCPGCYAYEPTHLGGTTLRQLTDLRGDALVAGVLALVRRCRPLHLSIVGGEPLVRTAELSLLLPKLNLLPATDRLNVEVQLVTSAVRPIPSEWAGYKCLHIVISVDGLAAEHDRRRFPATYDRILRHVTGHQVIVHCTVTRNLLGQDYLRDFASFWSRRPEVYAIWFSLYTPQRGDRSEERLAPSDRLLAVQQLADVAAEFPKVYMPKLLLAGLRRPPASPAECIFAQSTTCVSADLQTRIVPCQFGGDPVCDECGCMASAGFASIGNYRLAGILPISRIFSISSRIGDFAAHRESTARSSR
ncbi:MAG TPA: radical SAM protein [Verrucomicrobiae bacterium]|nr:radical SAM protein [Verrucomicrobiae bacterium]